MNTARRVSIRSVKFEGDQDYIQGIGMTWDPVVVDLEEDEEIVFVEASATPERASFNCVRSVVRVWIASAVKA